MIETHNLSKIYGSGENTVVALQSCNITFHDNEFTAIVGTSGSGKSTLLHLLGGLDTQGAGSVCYDGVDILAMHDRELSRWRRKNIGFIFQFFNLIGELTAEENILLPLMMDKEKVNKEYFEKLTEKLGIADRLNHYPAMLSGGQQQRVAICRALIHHPKVVLCDEPTGNLDSHSTNEVISLLEEIHCEEKTTILIVTHDNSIAARTRRIIQIEDGIVSEKS